MAVAVDRHRDLDRLVAGMRRGDHVFEPVFDPLHRPAQRQREKGADKFLGIDRGFLAEAASGMRHDDTDVVLRYVQMIGEVMAHDIGQLVADPHRQAERAFPIAGDAAAAFQAKRLLAADLELALDHEMRGGKRFVHLAALELALDQVIVRAAIVDQRRAVFFATPRIGHDRQGFVVDLDQLGRVFGGGAVFRHHRADRLAAEPDLVDGEPVLDQLAAGEAVGHAAERLDFAQQLLAGQHRDHAGQGAGLRGVDRADTRMRVLAAQKSHVVHARQADVVEEAAVAFDQRDRFVGHYRRADRSLIDETCIRHRADTHSSMVLACRATASTESTIAW